jgi:hypothetical protein
MITYMRGAGAARGKDARHPRSCSDARQPPARQATGSVLNSVELAERKCGAGLRI